MTNTKISALASASTPLTGTEVLPIVQGGSTVKVAVSDLTAGRNVTAARIDTTNNVGGGSMTSFSSGWANTTLELLGSGTTGDAILNSKNIAGTVGFGLEVQSNGTKIARIDSTGNYIPLAAKGVNFTANTPAAGMTSQLLNWYEEGTWTPVDASGAGLSISVTQALYVRIGRTVTINVFITYPATADATAASLGGLPFAVAGNNYPPITISTNSGVAIGALANAGTQTISIVSGVNASTNIINSVLSGKYVVMSGTYFIN
jgi:hypothetical protein